MSNKKRKTSEKEVVFEYTGTEEKSDIPSDVTIVRFRSNVTEVGNGLFRWCEQLKEVVFNEGLQKIGMRAFEQCIELECINFPSTLVEMDDSAFQYCRDLREVVLNEGLRKIGNFSFSNCSQLECINFPSTLVEINDYAFKDCSNLREVVFNEGLQTIPGLRKIGKLSFSYCNKLECINFPSTLVEIKDYAFKNCRQLKKLVLNEGLHTIGYESFYGCGIENINFPSTVTDIGDSAFCVCASLRKVVLNETLQTIRAAAFASCTSLECITFPSTVTEISERTFFNCPRLREVGLHEGIQKISIDAFGCLSLERFTFPNLSTRLNTITRAGQREVEDKIDNIRGNLVARRGSELFVSADTTGMNRVRVNWYILKGILGRIDRLIAYYEVKEATTLLELAIWKSKIDQVEMKHINRDEYRIDIPGPVKNNILQYLDFGV